MKQKTELKRALERPQNKSGRKIETRRMLLFLPLLILPLLAGTFYALGGGRGVNSTDSIGSHGINTTLPEARFSADSLGDKMSVYEKAGEQEGDSLGAGLSVLAERLAFDSGDDPQTKAIEARLSLLNQELAKPEPAPVVRSGTSRVVAGEGMDREVDKLELLMKSMSAPAGEDPELAQLSSMLQSIQEIQNPELARMKYAGNAASVEPVNESQFLAIPAVVEGDQKVLQGSVVRLRLLDTMRIAGEVFPAGHLVYGLAGFSNQRLNLEIKNIRLGKLIVPVNLTVFDQRDAMAGINAPDALLAEAVNGGIVDASGSVGISGFDLGTQIAGAGIDAARSLLARKVKRIRQPLKSGYPVLLRDNSKGKK